MSLKTRDFKIGVAALATVAVASLGIVAYATTSSKPMVSGALFGNIPNITVRGVQAGAAPWIVKGHVKLTQNHLWATGKWLLVPKVGYMATGQPVPKVIQDTTVGVTSIEAEITFANAKPVITAPVTLSKNGDFTINAAVTLPKGAAQPVVLIGPGTSKGLKAWFASSNFLFDYGLANSSTMSMKSSGSGSSSGGGSKSSGY